MNENSVGRWLKRAFRETPWSAGIIAANLVTWLLMFFGQGQVGTALAGELGVSTAWRWLTYPLFSPQPFLWFAIGLVIFYLFGGSLERRWGSEKFGRVFVVVTLLTACAYWCGYAVMQETLNPTATVAGLRLPDLTLFVIWAALNDEAPVLAYFVIPIRARYMAIGVLVLSFFDNGPILGLAAISVPIASWFWARRPESGRSGSVKKPGKSISQRFEERKRAKRKARFKLVEGNSNPLPETKVPDLKTLNRDVPEPKKSVNEAELDRILDKIRFEGMASLTPEEKDTLDSQSRKLNEQ
jgi:membrane associated rhomboid family serine protease